jgi:uncharacterized protein YggE
MENRNGLWALGMICVTLVLGVAVLRDVIWEKDYNTVSVFGVSKVPVTADAAMINLGVLTFLAPTPEEALKQTTDKVNQISAILEGMGIKAESRQLTGYVVNPRYADMYPKPDGTVGDPEIRGYTATQQLTVRIDGIDQDKSKIDMLIAAVTKAGANQVGEVKMLSSKGDELKQKARVMAIADAREKAKAVSEAAGVKIKKPVSWYENYVVNPWDQYKVGGYDPSAAPLNYSSVPSGYTPLAPGQLEIAVEMNVNFETR